MKKISIFLTVYFISLQFSYAQDFGNFPDIKKEKLLNDLDLIYQGLDKFHSGMYWYTPKDSVDIAFKEVINKINKDLNVLEFHKLVAPLIALSREDHTNIYLPKSVLGKLNSEAIYMPFTFIFLGKKLYCVKNGSNFQGFELEGKQIEFINGETPITIVHKIGNLFASDGFIKTSKYNDLRVFNFSKYYLYYYGQINEFSIKFKGIKEPIIIEPLNKKSIIKNLNKRYKKKIKTKKNDLLEFKILNDSVAYLGIHSFSNSDIKENSKDKDLCSFLKNSFKSIKENNIQTLVVDVSKNSEGTEGNAGLLYSYFGKNYKKYIKVRAKTQEAVLDNDVDQPITLKTFGFLERIFTNKKNEDGSLERTETFGKGLMAYTKEPKYKFSGKTYVIISPLTYSGGSEFSNMMYSQDLATFVGQETGGGYYGNTSGYSKKMVLPNSKIELHIPALQFMMNVKPKLPFGSGVIPHYKVTSTFKQYINGENASLNFILEHLKK
jgi:hypothetical protein